MTRYITNTGLEIENGADIAFVFLFRCTDRATAPGRSSEIDYTKPLRDGDVRNWSHLTNERNCMRSKSHSVLGLSSLGADGTLEERWPVVEDAEMAEFMLATQS